MYRPLKESDFVGMYRRVKGQDVYRESYIPVREDVKLRDGTTLRGMLAWGHPSAYEFRTYKGNIYAVRSWDVNPEMGEE